MADRDMHDKHILKQLTRIANALEMIADKVKDENTETVACSTCKSESLGECTSSEVCCNHSQWQRKV